MKHSVIKSSSLFSTLQIYYELIFQTLQYFVLLQKNYINLKKELNEETLSYNAAKNTEHHKVGLNEQS